MSDEDTGDDEEEEEDDEDDNSEAISFVKLAHEMHPYVEQQADCLFDPCTCLHGVWRFQDGNVANQPKKKRRFGRSIMRSFKRKVSYTFFLLTRPVTKMFTLINMIAFGYEWLQTCLRNVFVSEEKENQREKHECV